MSRAKALIKRLVPRPILRRGSWFVYHPRIQRLWSGRFRRRLRIHRAVYAATNGTVASGPFAGMRYCRSAQGSAYSPKLLGTYEKELWPVVTKIGQRGYAVIIDIGAAEGYYAVGFARGVPTARVIAFELALHKHHLLREMALLNGVQHRIEVFGACTPKLLSAALRGGSRRLVICDVEGYEREVLDPDLVPALLAADVLVEVHEQQVPGITTLLRSRFEDTHEVQAIDSRPRGRDDWPAGVHAGQLSDQDEQIAISEFRSGEMTWLWMRARR